MWGRQQPFKVLVWALIRVAPLAPSPSCAPDFKSHNNDLETSPKKSTQATEPYLTRNRGLWRKFNIADSPLNTPLCPPPPSTSAWTWHLFSQNFISILKLNVVDIPRGNFSKFVFLWHFNHYFIVYYKYLNC